MRYWADQEFDTIDLAIQYSKDKGFETAISFNHRMVGIWGPITGFKELIN